ncbi:MAG: 4-amino-4-deoxy-L-arabinose transferase-like glycosyltransferase [Bradymonadia bacterium]|jgi:4-amino-4-deoxy-L-arabinose transferase-like glycosyltransferase
MYRHPNNIDRLIALLIAAGTILVLAQTAEMGFTRDESFYFHAASEYAGWFAELGENWENGELRESFTQQSVDRHWSYNPEHPVLVKTTFALSGMLFHDKLGWMSSSLAYRFPAMLFTGWLCAVMYLFALGWTRSRAVGVLAPLLLMTIPRFFFHAHLTCFDVPVTAVWVAFMYSYWRSLDSTKWAWITGFMWGIALITKLNAFFLPIVLLAHWGLRAALMSRVRKSARIEVPKVPFALFAMAILGPIIFVLGWPRHWFDTWNRVLWYLRFHLNHEHYFVLYFGHSLIRPPFPATFPLVMSLVTTPLATLFAWALGTGFVATDWIKQLRDNIIEERGTALLFALNIAVPILIIARTSTPVFGGIKHWFPSLPFLCIIGAWGIVRLGQMIVGERPKLALAIAGVLGFTAVGTAAYETADSHPYGTAHYNALVGSISGAADRDTMRQFWGYASRGALDWLNENAEEGARVHFQNTTQGAVDMYKREGWLRDDIRSAWTVDSADYFLLHHQKSFAPLHYEVWERFQTQSPVFTVNLHGVPMLSVYQNRSDEAEDRIELRGAELEGSGTAFPYEFGSRPERSGDNEGSGDTNERSGDNEGSGDMNERSGDNEGSGDTNDVPAWIIPSPLRPINRGESLRMPGINPGL